MKRLVSLMLALALCLSLPAALAEILSLGEPTSPVKEVGQREGLRSDIPSREGIPTPIDTVQIEGAVFTITSSGATAAFQAPFGWLLLSQDMVQQLAEYARMQNPLALVNKLIDNELSLLAVDPETGANIYAFFLADNISALALDLSNEALMKSLMEYYQGEVVTVAERPYIRVVTSSSLIYLTFHQGVRVSFQLMMAGEQPTEQEEQFILEFIEPTQFL